MPCYCGFENREAELEWFLCKACRLLSAKEMKKIYHGYPEGNLLKLYMEHLWRDFIAHEDNIEKVQKEWRRLGMSYRIIVDINDDKYWFKNKKLNYSETFHIFNESRKENKC